MKSFLQLVEEKAQTHHPVVMAFGRMNPPTTGHLKLIDKEHKLPIEILAASIELIIEPAAGVVVIVAQEAFVPSVVRYLPELPVCVGTAAPAASCVAEIVLSAI